MDHRSFWQKEKAPQFSSLQGDIEANTVIVGAGLCGLLCAYLLYQKGVTGIVIVDANEVCSGVTANTTAKITSQHGLLYTKLMKGFDLEKAAEYAAANERAVRMYQEIIEKEKISCDFALCSAWVYTTLKEHIQDIKEEAEAAKRLDIAASYKTETELPLAIKGAVEFHNQAHFHPLKFAFSIVDILSKAGCKFYTNTKALFAEERVVRTEKGDIYAKHIIACTHYPFIDKSSLLFAKIYQERSYVLAIKGVPAIHDMYIDCVPGGLSFRPQKDEHNHDMILFGAYDHKTGHENEKLHFDSLIKNAKKYYPDGEIAYMWSAQDCMTHDQIPYIGQYLRANKNIYIATGFNKWGMTSAMAAADIISDLITKGKSDNYSIFSTVRKDIGLQAKSFVKESVDIVGNFLTHLTKPQDELEDIERNEGRIVEIGSQRMGVYKDMDGKLHAVKPVCTHMGCSIKWNKDENTWDCTCHGSRFDYKGHVIGGPAQKNLEYQEVRYI